MIFNLSATLRNQPTLKTSFPATVLYVHDTPRKKYDMP